jgi:hypothetical protein
MPSKKPAARVKKTVRAKKPSRVTKVLGPRLTVVAVICVAATGMLFAARQQSSRSTETTPASIRAEALATSATSKAADVPNTAVTAATDSLPVAKAPAVTVTGCLERTNDAFRLKDTTGADVPKARSWKSGFLKKGSASIDVVDAAHAFRLADFVGRRVSVTGTLVDREMQVRSMRRISPTCGQASAH